MVSMEVDDAGDEAGVLNETVNLIREGDDCRMTYGFSCTVV